MHVLVSTVPLYYDSKIVVSLNTDYMQNCELSVNIICLEVLCDM